MYNNIGGKIKSLARVICIIGIVLSVIGGIIIMAQGFDEARFYAKRIAVEAFFVGILAIGLGSLVSWLSCFLLYGFGQLIDDTSAIKRKLYGEGGKKKKKPDAETETYEREAEDDGYEYIGSASDRSIEDSLNDPAVSNDEMLDIPCPRCGERLSFPKETLLTQDTVVCPYCGRTVRTSEYRL